MDTIFLPIKPGKQYTKLVDGTKTYYGMADAGAPLNSARWALAKVETGVSYLGKTMDVTTLPVGQYGNPSSSEAFAFSEVLNLTFSQTKDETAPTLSTVTIASNNTDTTKAKVGDTVTITIVSDESLQSLTATIAGHAATIVTTDSKHYTASYVMVTGDTAGIVPFTIDFSDIAGIAGVQVTAVTGGSGVTFDKTVPTAAITYSKNAGVDYSSTISVQDSDTLIIKATFTEAIKDSPIVKLAIDNTILSASNMTKVSTTVYTYSLNVPAGPIPTATVSLSVGVDTAGNAVASAPTSGATFEIV